MALVDQVTGMFRAKTEENIDTVRERLTEAEAAVSPIEQRLRDVSLSCALSGNFKPADKLATELQAAKERVEVLRRALDAASAAEAQRLADARTKQQRATLRAARAHLAAIVRATEEYEASAAKMFAAWQRMVVAAESFQAIIGPRWQRDYSDIGELRLTRLGEKELLRIGHKIMNVGPVPWMPGSRVASPFSGTPVFQLLPISQAVSTLAAQYGEQLARELSLAAEPPPQPAEQLVNEASVAEAEPPREPGDDKMKVMDALKHLVGKAQPEPEPLPFNPHPPGSEEWHGFEAVLAMDKARGETATNLVAGSPQ